MGVFVGFVTTAIFFPRILNREQIGLMNTLVSYSTVFAQFATLGFNSVIIRNFSYFRNYENKHNHFFFLVLWVMIIGSFLSVLAYFILKPFIIRQNIVNAPLFVEYIDYLVPLIIFTLVFYILDTYYTVLFKSVRGIFLKEFAQRVFVLIALYFYFIKLFSFTNFTLWYVVSLSLPAVILFVFIITEGEFTFTPKFDFISRNMARSMFSVGIFGILTSLVSTANMQIDRAMSSSLISLEATGIYSTVYIFASLIKVPSRAMLKIAAAVIADAWKRNDTLEINKIYKATCLNQYIIALLVLVGLWGNIDNIFHVLPQDYLSGKYAILLLGIAFTIEVASGASINIIATSKYYKMLTWLVLVSLIVMLVSNFVFIPLYQISGVALATAITTIVFAFLKIFYVYYKFGMQPFDLKFFYLTGIGIGTYLISKLLPVFDNFIVDICVRSAGISIIYGFLILTFRISPEINGRIWKLFRKS
jgi:O-antigen/teichoic acid export membrane protein